MKETLKQKNINNNNKIENKNIIDQVKLVRYKIQFSLF